MKKIFFGLLALVAFAATSCQQDVDLAVKAGKTAVVSFEVGTATRAYSDGETATVLQYAVYNAAGEELTDLTKSLKNDNAETINISKTVDFKLVTGNTYTVIFWAAAPNAPYAVDFENQTMTVDYNGMLSNNEALDAFYAHETFTVVGSTSKTIYLKRPFAQLNIGTNDYAAAKSAGFEPEYSTVTVDNVFTTLNLFTDEVSTPAVVTYGWNNIPAGEKFPVDDHKYLAMNYLLVAKDKAVVNVDFDYSETAATEGKVRTVGSVPVQRNYRTNLYGQLLTSDVAVNVIISPEYEEPDYETVVPNVVAVASGNEFTKALEAGEAEIKLAENITITSNYQLQKSANIDLNGYTLEAPMVNIHSTATIKNGTISGKVYARAGANIVLEGVTLSGAVSDNLSTEGHLAIKPGCTLYLKDCVINATSVSGSQTRPISFEGGASNMKFENCEFKSSQYKKQVYFNSLSATASLEFVNCNFNNKNPNIMFAAAAPFTVLKMTGTTKLSSVTLETNRAKDAITDADLAYMRDELIANNSMSSVRLFYAGGSSEYIR